MALKSGMMRSARKLAEVIKTYAKAQGWTEQDFAVSILFEKRTDRFSISVGSVRPLDDKAWYLGIFKAFREAFPDDPYLPLHVGLVIENVKSLDQIYYGIRVDDDEIDLSDSY